MSGSTRMIYTCAAGALLAISGIFSASNIAIAPFPSAVAQPVANHALIPPGKNSDLKLYLGAGGTIEGREALSRMNKDADVILWLAGNQFFAMDEVIAAFHRQSPGVKVGLITLPPGLLLEAIEKGGWSYEGASFPGRPDVYASVNIGHLSKLKAVGMMDTYNTYMHNELQIIVAKGNPKGIIGIKDLGREDVKTSMPNPINEGIMQFYARKVLERHRLWQTISAGKECVLCQTTERNWFTQVHHRETPERIKAGASDAGIVWKTEVLEALRDGAQIEGIELPLEDSLRQEVSYVIGSLKDGRPPRQERWPTSNFFARR